MLQLAVDALVLEKVQQEMKDTKSRIRRLEAEVISKFGYAVDDVDSETWLEVLGATQLLQSLGSRVDASLVVIRKHSTKERNESVD